MTDGLAPTPSRVLHAGPLTLVFERAGIRWVRFGAHEILRGIYVGVRDAHWRTIPATVRDVVIDAQDDAFRIELVAEHRHLDLDFLWRGTILGESDGSLSFTMDGVARRSFLKNRIGFCVLHPTEACSGRPCTVEHVDGHIASTSFPALVSPHQAFFNVRALAHEVTPGVIAEVRVDGDIFETEDQRNWSDTSFKTYGTPVDLPFPVELREGTQVRQEVRLRLRRVSAPPETRVDRDGPRVAVGHPHTRDDVVSIEATDASCAIPRIGLMLDATQPLTARERDRLRALGPAHLRVDLDLMRPDWETAFEHAIAQAESVGTRLHVAALVSSPDADAPGADAPDVNAQLTALADAAAASGRASHVDAWLLFDRATGTTPGSLLTRARKTLGARTQGRIGGGSDKHFADLNRQRPLAALLDLLCYPVSPQAHADDAETMVENVGSVATVVETAHAFAPDLPVAISPVTLKPRFRSGGPQPPALAALPDHIDARQASRLAAAWTIAHLRACAEAGVASVTYFRTVGWDGVMEREAGSPLPGVFPSRPGMVFPLYHALADVGGFAGGRVLITRSAQPARVEALCLEREGAWRLLLVNLRPEPQRVQLPPMLADRSVLAHARILRLNARTERDAADAPELFRAGTSQAGDSRDPASPFLLDGHEIVRLDFETPSR